jgi:RNA polymerase sigma-70 factor (ECF subfamily)
MNAFAAAVSSWLMASSEGDEGHGRVPHHSWASDVVGAARSEAADDSAASSDVSPVDAATINGLRNGDPATYDHVFRTHYEMLVGFATSFLHDRAYAEDVVGNVFVWVYEHRAALKISGSLRGYLFASVRHAALNAQRGRDRELARYTRMQAMDPESIAPAAPRPVDEAVADTESNAQLHSRVARALEQLPEQARLILALRIHRGLGYDEIATALGISRVAAKQRFSRSVAALRALLPDLLE